MAVVPESSVARFGERPSAQGRFGEFGGRFVPETLMPALIELEKAFARFWTDEEFQTEYRGYLTDYVGRPSPLTHAKNLSRELNLEIYFKREDLNHTGSHKINNALGQAILAKRMGKKRIIAETGAGQHGVATATACALLGLDCVVYMGIEDTRRQRLNVVRMRLLGAEVREVTSGTQTLKDAMNEAMRDWVTNVTDTHYIIGTAAGPHPYPYMVREFQSVIGAEAKEQFLKSVGTLPDSVVACVGGGSNAIGIFSGFFNDPVRLIGVEAGGESLESGRHAAPLTTGTPGVLHGSYSYLMQDADGQISETHSISAGLDYPGVGAEHSHLKQMKRAEYVAATDEQAMQGLQLLSRTEGLIPAIESAHAVAALSLPNMFRKGEKVLVNLSGRGDKDMETVAKYFQLDLDS